MTHNNGKEVAAGATIGIKLIAAPGIDGMALGIGGRNNPSGGVIAGDGMTKTDLSVLMCKVRELFEGATVTELVSSTVSELVVIHVTLVDKSESCIVVNVTVALSIKGRVVD